MKNNLLDFLKSNNILPNDISIYEEAVTHQSFVNENELAKKNYQRLEFLGDSIISKLISEFLYKNFVDLKEGEMSLLRAKFVSGKALSKTGTEIGLDKLIRLGNGQVPSVKIVEDIFEAFVGAIYLDQGEEKTFEFLNKHIFEKINDTKNESIKNPKTILQEYLQADSRKDIRYETTQDGKEFVSNVFHDNSLFGNGKGKTKKEAEVNAALNALTRMGKINETN